jgi:1,4-dihydroxy-6-naphthoate synthase
MKLSLAFSPCPNDTFMFDALVHHKIDTLGLEFEITLADVEELNRNAFNFTFDVSKLSYHAYGFLSKDYQLLSSGSALGNNCGPLLVSRKGMPQEPSFYTDKSIAIPGKFTTANFLLGIALPGAKNKKEMLFSDIEKAVLNQEADAGLLIHENRFTYEQKGLVKILDLGEHWESFSKSPIPLGGIAVKRNLPEDIKEKLDFLLRQSIQYAFDNPSSSEVYVREHAQEMDRDVMYNHINLYVNEYSLDLGIEGKKAVGILFSNAREKGLIPEIQEPVFIGNKLYR